MDLLLFFLYQIPNYFFEVDDLKSDILVIIYCLLMTHGNRFIMLYYVERFECSTLYFLG